MSMTVRRATAEDLQAVMTLEREIAEAPHWPLQTYEVMLVEDEASAVRRALFVAVAEPKRIQGFAVGRVLVLPDAIEAELESIAVARQARRCGVGRALCRAVLDWCQAKGAAAVELEVRRQSLGAQALYWQLGFVETGTRPGYYQEPADDAVVMCYRVEG